MAGPTIGQVAVDVTADASGLGDGLTRDINGQLRNAKGQFAKESANIGQAGGDAAGKGWSARFGSRFKSDISSIGGVLARAGSAAMRTAGAVVGGVAAAGIATALTKGLSRLTAIEDAEAKLRGLGNSTQDVEKIMASALAAVEGTAFGLDAAATTAAGAIAAGVKPGEDLDRVLRAVANAAAASGMSMEDMGAIFNTVASQGRAYTQQINQLAHQGIPIWAELAKVLGVTEEEVRKMASEGKVSFEDFEKAATAASGNVAEEMGKTTRGSFANFRTAIANLGASFLKPVFQRLPPIFNALKDALKGMTPAAERMGEVVAGALDRVVEAAERVGAVLGPIWDRMGDTGKAVVGIGGIGAALASALPALTAFVPGLGKFVNLGGIVKGLGVIFRGLLGPVGLVAGALLLAYQNSEPFRNALQSLLGTLKEAGKTILTGLLPAFEGMGNPLGTIGALLGAVGKVIGGVLAAVIPLIEALISGLAPVIVQVASGLLPLLSAALDAVKEVFVLLAPVIGGVITTLGSIIQSLLPVVQTVFSAIGPIVSAALGILINILKVFTSVLRGDWAGAWGALQAITDNAAKLVGAIVKGLVGILVSLFTALGSALKNLFKSMWNSIKSTVSGAVSAIGSLVRAGWNSIRATTASVWNAIRTAVSSAVNAVRSAVSSAFNAVRSTTSSAWNGVRSAISGAVNAARSAVSSAFNGMVSAVSGAVGRVASAVSGLRGRIMSALSGLAGALTGIGRQMIMGLINGIRGAAGAVASAARSVVSNAISAAKSALKIKSPSRVFMDIGADTGEGLAVGLRNSAPRVALAGSGLAQSAIRPVQQVTRNNIRNTGGTTVHQGATVTNTPTINQNYYGPTTNGGRLQEVSWALRYATRARSRPVEAFAT